MNFIFWVEASTSLMAYLLLPLGGWIALKRQRFAGAALMLLGTTFGTIIAWQASQVRMVALPPGDFDMVVQRLWSEPSTSLFGGHTWHYVSGQPVSGGALLVFDLPVEQWVALKPGEKVTITYRNYATLLGPAPSVRTAS